MSASTSYLDEGSPWNDIFEALDAAFVELGIDAGIQIPVYRGQPPGSGRRFEEKLIPPMDGFGALCERVLSRQDTEAFNWDLLVPVDFDGAIELPLPNFYSPKTTVRSAHRMLPHARRLADAIGLPAEVPVFCDSMQLTSYFMDFEESGSSAAAPPGPWRDDLSTAFYVALSLRAAEHAIRLRCPLFCA